MQGNQVHVAVRQETIGRHANKVLEPEAARHLTDQIRVNLDTAYQFIVAAYRGRAWKALGYSSWDDYITREFGNLHLRPPRESQQEVVHSLHQAGLSVRAIGTATQLGYGTVQRLTSATPDETTSHDHTGDPLGSPEARQSQGQDGKMYPARRTTPTTPPISAAVEGAVLTDEVPDQISVEDMMAMPADVAGIVPLDLEEQAGRSAERVSRMLREFNGSGDAALPRTIKLAGQVAGLVSPVTGQSLVEESALHTLAFDVTCGLRTFSYVVKTLARALAAGESEAAIKSNLRDSVDELDAILEQLEDER